MDFFDHQDLARRNTHWLVLYFLLAVAFIVMGVYLAVNLVFFGVEAKTGFELSDYAWNLDVLLWITVVTLSVIVIGTLYKIVVLSKGGEVVARALDGRPVDPNTTDLRQRRLLNVVEEMAIASGIPVPSVFLLEKEKGINAFAAGFSSTDAVIGVTEGALELLSRDELQGVIGHELSHVLNGDMRLNIRLLGLLHGILVIALIGRSILRGTKVSSSSGKKGGNAPVVIFAITLVAIGLIGVFFGKLIKSSVSRQREFLADASAVQFTRNPTGVAGALKKIGGLIHGSGVKHPKAEEASHFFFADGVRGSNPSKTSSSAFAIIRRFPGVSMWREITATHPPLQERIRRIDPSFDGSFPEVRTLAPSDAKAPELKKAYPSPSPAVAFASDHRSASRDSRREISVVPRDLIPTVGKITQAHLAHAVAILAGLPSRLIEKAHDPSGARAVAFALLLSREPGTRRIQFKVLTEAEDPLCSRETLEISSLVDRSPPEARLPLIDLALPALRRLSLRQFREFKGLVRCMIQADRKIELFEYTLLHVLHRHIDPYFSKISRATVKYRSLRSLGDECSLLLSALAHAGHEDEEYAKRAFMKGIEELRAPQADFSLRSGKESTLDQLSDALEKLVFISPTLKRRLIAACAACVSHDYRVTVQEGELLRAVSDSLDCPMPPFLAGQELERPGPDRL